jgi:hypothetical protein
VAEARAGARQLEVHVGGATLDASKTSGRCVDARHELSWELDYVSPEPTLLLLPEPLYARGFPKAKALVGSPLARFSGTLTCDGATIAVDDWVGSQNHNWGARHTDRYAWGQVAGFDDAPTAFLECATARLRVGSWPLPALSPVVLRIGGEEWRFSELQQALRARARYGRSSAQAKPGFCWSIASRNRRARIQITFEAEASDFVALPYDDPPGGQKLCLNSKLAACRVRLERAGQPELRLTTRHRAAFEILGDPPAPGVWRLDTPEPQQPDSDSELRRR